MSFKPYPNLVSDSLDEAIKWIKYVTRERMSDTGDIDALSNTANGITVPVKATGAEVDTGTDDAKFLTAKAINDSHNVPMVAPSTSGNIMTSNGTDWVSAAPPTSVPTGSMLDFAGTAVPTGYLACDGSAISRTTYAALFTAISTTWGVGNGTTTFNIPDFSRRVAVGSGGSGTGTLGNAVGNTGGEETHTLSSGELAAHTHDGSGMSAGSDGAHTHTVQSSATAGGGNTSINASVPTDRLTTAGITTTSNGAHTHTISGNTGSTGSGTAHNNMQPSAVVLKIIKT